MGVFQDPPLAFGDVQHDCVQVGTSSANLSSTWLEGMKMHGIRLILVAIPGALKVLRVKLLCLR